MISGGSPLAAEVVGAVAEVTGFSVAFAVKHYLADFLLQTSAIARGKEARDGWALPLLAHAATHAAMTLAIVLAAAPRLWWLAAVDLGVHVAVDRGKSLVAQRGGWAPAEPQFWWLLGFDQLLHQLTNIGLAAALVLL